MNEWKKAAKAGLMLGTAAFMLFACGPASSPSASPPESAAVPIGSAPNSDPLVGLWKSAPFTLSDVEAALHGQFKSAPINAIEALDHSCLPKEGDTHVITLHFGAGQLVISDSTNGGPSREGWTGSYAVQDSNTYAAGGEDLYITVDYTVKGDRLITNLIADRFPDHTPWTDAQDGPGASKLNGIVSKPLGDQICQAATYDTMPFTRAG